MREARGNEKVRKVTALVLIGLTFAIVVSVVLLSEVSGAQYTKTGVQAGVSWKYTSSTSTSTYLLTDTNLLSKGFSTHWYAGSVYPWWLPAQNASAIYMSIKVPSSAPKADEFYAVIVSAHDSNGSYDQIGFGNWYGTWVLEYSWTSGPLSNPTYHTPRDFSDTINLTQGTTYTFWISVENGVAHFGAELGAHQEGTTPLWSLNATTGGDYLVLSNTYSGYGGYTNYEEVYLTDIAGGSPNFDFYFYDNYWEALNHTTYPATWTTLTTAPPNPPTSVAVQINGSAVLVHNDYVYTPAPTIDQPSSLSFVVGQFEGNITWHPSSQYPDYYTISVDGGSPTFYSWNGTTITYSIDGWSAGSYNVTCTVHDTLGRTATSTVEVTTITPAQYTPLTLAVVIGAVGTAIVIAEIVLLRKKRKTTQTVS